MNWKELPIPSPERLKKETILWLAVTIIFLIAWPSMVTTPLWVSAIYFGRYLLAIIVKRKLIKARQK